MKNTDTCAGPVVILLLDCASERFIFKSRETFLLKLGPQTLLVLQSGAYYSLVLQVGTILGTYLPRKIAFGILVLQYGGLISKNMKVDGQFRPECRNLSEYLAKNYTLSNEFYKIETKRRMKECFQHLLTAN